MSYQISLFLNKKHFSAAVSVVLLFACLGGMIIIIIWNIENLGVGVIYNCYFILLVGIAASDHVGNLKQLRFYRKPIIGEFASVMYILHWMVAVVLNQFSVFTTLNFLHKRVAFFGGTIIISIVLLYLNKKMSGIRAK